jgi:quercetin dioxygenase-like cupin family protein
MVSHCANPACRAPLHYLRGGRLYRFDVNSPGQPCHDVPNAICASKPARAAIFFWLCERCSSRFSLKFDLRLGVRLIPERALVGKFSSTPVARAVQGRRVREQAFSEVQILDQEEAMTTPQMTIHNGRVREPGVLAATSLKFNLEEEIRQLRAEPRWQAGHTAKTIAKYADFRVVLVVMKAGAQLVRHRTAGRISIQACRGSIRVLFTGEFKNETVDMSAGDLLMLDREVAHDVEALTIAHFCLRSPGLRWIRCSLERYWLKR